MNRTERDLVGSLMIIFLTFFLIFIVSCVVMFATGYTQETSTSVSMPTQQEIVDIYTPTTIDIMNIIGY